MRFQSYARATRHDRAKNLGYPVRIMFLMCDEEAIQGAFLKKVGINFRGNYTSALAFDLIC